ncbi:hypothetical protein N9A28_00165 [Sulfurimonas sp.]|nr:hypothetical protein [Sulfurimonas sp.]
MKNIYNYKAYEKGKLLRTTLLYLSEQIDPKSKVFKKYERIIKKEVKALEKIGFDGYMLLLEDIVVVAKEISGFVACFGTIQNSLTAHILGIVDDYELNEENFKEFTPFTDEPVVHIVISSYANNGCVGYVAHKYADIIKKKKKRSIVFKDNLKIKFVDLDINIRTKYDEDGFRI